MTKSDLLTIDWINEQRTRSELAASVDIFTFRKALNNLEASLQRIDELETELSERGMELADMKQD